MGFGEDEDGSEAAALDSATCDNERRVIMARDERDCDTNAFFAMEDATGNQARPP